MQRLFIQNEPPALKQQKVSLYQICYSKQRPYKRGEQQNTHPPQVVTVVQSYHNLSKVYLPEGIIF
jgi:hypothetical protein